MWQKAQRGSLFKAQCCTTATANNTLLPPGTGIWTNKARSSWKKEKAASGCTCLSKMQAGCLGYISMWCMSATLIVSAEKMNARLCFWTLCHVLSEQQNWLVWAMNVCVFWWACVIFAMHTSHCVHRNSPGCHLCIGTLLFWHIKQSHITLWKRLKSVRRDPNFMGNCLQSHISQE